MRFGHDFHGHIVPEWSQHYVDYNLLKGLVKLSCFSGRVKTVSLLVPGPLLM